MYNVLRSMNHERQRNAVDRLAQSDPIYKANCSVCGDFIDGKPNLCSGCKVAAYCSRDCQKDGWKTHQAQCKKLLEEYGPKGTKKWDVSNEDDVLHPAEEFLFDVPTTQLLLNHTVVNPDKSRPTGLTNIGNTCFLNSGLQCLLATAPLMLLLKERVYTSSFKKSTSSKASEAALQLELLAKRYVDSTSSYGSISPRDLASVLSSGPRRMFRLLRQEDSHEFVIQLIDRLHEAFVALEETKPSYKVSQTTVISQLFGHYVQSELKCPFPSCGYASRTFNVETCMQLEMYGLSSLEDCLKHYTAYEQLDRENMWKCGRCGRMARGVRRLSIAAESPILTIMLKRFNLGLYKDMRPIEFSEDLDIAPYMSDQESVESERKKGDTMYELYGAVVHIGRTALSGHYIAFVKKGKTWYCCDDSHVSKTSFSEVCDSKPYLLFYKKKNAQVGSLSRTQLSQEEEGEGTESESEKDEFEKAGRKSGSSSDADDKHDTEYDSSSSSVSEAGRQLNEMYLGEKYRPGASTIQTSSTPSPYMYVPENAESTAKEDKGGSQSEGVKQKGASVDDYMKERDAYGMGKDEEEKAASEMVEVDVPHEITFPDNCDLRVAFTLPVGTKKQDVLAIVHPTARELELKIDGEVMKQLTLKLSEEELGNLDSRGKFKQGKKGGHPHFFVTLSAKKR